VRDYGKYLDINSTVVFGGVGMNPQIDRIKRGVDILVATPGRLLDLQQQGFLDLSTVKFWCWTKPTACSTWASSMT
jgi:ATP-dependent RNA helicase RhlE